MRRPDDARDLEYQSDEFLSRSHSRRGDIDSVPVFECVGVRVFVFEGAMQSDERGCSTSEKTTTYPSNTFDLILKSKTFTLQLACVPVFDIFETMITF